MLYFHKINNFIVLSFLATIVGVTLSCTTAPAPERENAISKQYGMQETRTNAPVRLGSSEKPDSGLSDPAFKKLNKQVLAYLESLADAFYTRDTEWLLAQAESFYQKTYQGLYPTDEYLAMLYRVGAYSTETPNSLVQEPSLNIKKVVGITYTGWEELGPVLEVRGTILFANGKNETCRIILLWRLGDIKIKGFEP